MKIGGPREFEGGGEYYRLISTNKFPHQYLTEPEIPFCSTKERKQCLRVRPFLFWSTPICEQLPSALFLSNGMSSPGGSERVEDPPVRVNENS
ncbi:hypothetical protein AVEN_100910-1 [Araneus ventricosus]|uniref:Uncharacterized protein n=1 Tax=Araneus ventricosus TaxID=182803 RepID=A0A4Y2AYF0_ARAVE|nr:hypothetical protein AVEN_100910-1 [Araneus ventricosus]